MADKWLDYAGVETLWRKIRQRYDKKLDSVINRDDSIEVTSGREIAVKVSPAENNILKVIPGEGMYADMSALHKLKFGPYEYDGSKDVIVEIYDGDYIIRKVR